MIQLGAIRFDRDMRAITTYLSSQTAFGDVRDKFLRLQQIATLLNLDSVGTSLPSWRISLTCCLRRRMWMSFTTDQASPGNSTRLRPVSWQVYEYDILSPPIYFLGNYTVIDWDIQSL